MYLHMIVFEFMGPFELGFAHRLKVFVIKTGLNIVN